MNHTVFVASPTRPCYLVPYGVQLYIRNKIDILDSGLDQVDYGQHLENQRMDERILAGTSSICSLSAFNCMCTVTPASRKSLTLNTDETTSCPIRSKTRNFQTGSPFVTRGIMRSFGCPVPSSRSSSSAFRLRTRRRAFFCRSRRDRGCCCVCCQDEYGVAIPNSLAQSSRRDVRR